MLWLWQNRVFGVHGGLVALTRSIRADYPPEPGTGCMARDSRVRQSWFHYQSQWQFSRIVTGHPPRVRTRKLIHMELGIMRDPLTHHMKP